MGGARPVEYEVLGAHQVVRNNLLESRRCALPVGQGSNATQLALRAAVSLPEGGVTFQVRAGRISLGLAIGETEFCTLYPEGVADIPITNLPETLGLALGQATLRPILDALSTSLGASLALEGMSGPVPADWQPVGLDALIDGKPRPMAVLYLNAEAEDALIRFLEAQPSTRHWEGAGGARMPLSVLLPGLDFKRNELDGLKPGTILLLPEGTDPDRFCVCVGARFQQVGLCRLSDNKVIVEQLTDDIMTGDNEEDIESWVEDEAAEPGVEQEVAPETTELTLDGVEVRVDFVLGRTTMSFAELQGLAPGVVINLNKPVSHAVNILVSGRTIGDGELVQIDDRLGVRIVRLIEKADD